MPKKESVEVIANVMIMQLLWPPSILSPNSRAHWSAKVEPKQAARSEGWAVTRLAMQEKGIIEIDPSRISMMYLFYPPDKRKRDLDNLLSSMKSYQDGMADAFGIDDSMIGPVTVDWGKYHPDRGERVPGTVFAIAVFVTLPDKTGLE